MAHNLDPRSSARAEFAVELLSYRKRAKLSQTQVARHLNCDQSLVSCIERCDRAPQLEHAQALDRLFGVVDEAVYGTTRPPFGISSMRRYCTAHSGGSQSTSISSGIY
jgi:transcriptional regulator with XRE-family HTH domain